MKHLFQNDCYIEHDKEVPTYTKNILKDITRIQGQQLQRKNIQKYVDYSTANWKKNKDQITVLPIGNKIKIRLQYCQLEKK